jgi:hypothetical protein
MLGTNPQGWQFVSALCETARMPRLEDHIDRILGDARECLTAVEITLRLNAEFGDSEAYTITEVVACAD